MSFKTMDTVYRELRMESLSPVPHTSRFTGMRIHFIGIGGSGMSGLARMLVDLGAIVSGSEPKPNAQTFELVKRGVKISRDQLGESLPAELDLVVRSAAVKDNNPEFLGATRRNIETVKYARMLGMLMQERFGIAVAGTHGKSTTTAMIAYMLLRCGCDPSFVVGGTISQLGGGSRSGKGKAFVAEACEFDRSFHNLHSRVALITNMEEDHLDCYKNLDEIVESFHTFAAKVPLDGLIIADANDRNIRRSLEQIKCQVQTTALDGEGDFDAEWSTQITWIDRGCYRGIVRRHGREVCELKLRVAGLHNMKNATMAIAACAAYGVSPEQSAAALADFEGVDRRMTIMGQFNGATVVDDYGHHPTEVRATLKALRERFNPRRLFCVFQPHQHSRTRFLLDDFASSFAEADETVVPDIYFVRDSESEKQLVCAVDLVNKIIHNGHRARYMPAFGEIVSALKKDLCPGDLVVTMGAGNVWEIGRDLCSDVASEIIEGPVLV